MVWPSKKPAPKIQNNDTPEPLVHWHELSQAWDSGITHQNYAIPLNELKPEKGKIPFWCENQGNSMWAFDPTSQNQLVYELSRDDSWEKTSVDISTFLRISTINEAIYGSPAQEFIETSDPWNLFFPLENLQLEALNLDWPHPQSRTIIGRSWLALVDPGRIPGTYEVTLAAKLDSTIRDLLSKP